MNPTYDFTGQVALVTGGSSGMGLATVHAFAEAAQLSSSPTSTRKLSARPRTTSRRQGTRCWPSDVTYPTRPALRRC